LNSHSDACPLPVMMSPAADRLFINVFQFRPLCGY
jgi:hypothetical protein